MLKGLLFLSAVAFCQLSLADSFTSYSRLDCSPSLGYFKFESRRIYSEFKSTDEQYKSDQRKNNYSNFKNTSCALPSGKISLEFSEYGRDNSDYYVTVKLNDKVILEKLYLEIAIFNAYNDDFQLKELQGEYLDNGEYPSITATFQYKSSGAYISINLDPRKESLDKKALLVKLKAGLKDLKEELSKE